jgi:biopolymer transport protein ExbD
LLIYFILTTTFRQAEGQIPGTLPKAGSAGADTMERLKEPIKITLHPTGASNEAVAYEISGEHAQITEPAALYQKLKERRESGGVDSPVIINSRRDVRWRFVVEVFNQVVANEFKNIAFQNAT